MLFAHTLYEGFGLLVITVLFLIVFAVEMIQRADKNNTIGAAAARTAARGGMELLKRLIKK